jgi:hypothetical protein
MHYLLHHHVYHHTFKIKLLQQYLQEIEQRTTSIEQRPSWEANIYLLNQSRRSRQFMEAETSLLYLKETAISPYHEPDNSTPDLHILFP